MYTDEWAVHIKEGPEKARQLADKHGFIYEGEIIPEFYMYRHKRVVKRSAEPSHHLHKSLAEEPEVLLVEQQYVKRRVKRTVTFNDPSWTKMWYLKRLRCLDMNVQRAWEMGYSGKGSVVTILDDGIEKDHPDLKQNYDKLASTDINDNDPDPQPRLDIFNYNRHGTRCAGEVAAVANNSICSVGIAYKASIGGVRMLDGDITDSVEARSIGFSQQHIDLYSASWGPDDDGRTVDGPGPLAKQAFKMGVESGRSGKGNIFVWASGNGGRQGDSCSCDGYTNSIYTLSVSSATERGTVPWYSEPCSSTLATTYSSGSGSDRMIMSTDLRHGCTDRHTGTSASAPLAAGVIAVVLEANPQLTWRDVQHITVRTANPKHLLTSDWVMNGAGLKVSHSFGYGMMDTSAMVDLAKNWTTVPPAVTCTAPGSTTPKAIGQNQAYSSSITTDGCIGTEKQIKVLEHVQARVTVEASKRGDLSIYLTSPSGTKSTLLPRRPRDYHSEGFRDWEFLSVHSWGESPVGKWTLEVQTKSSNTVLKHWSLIMHGTKTLPSTIPLKSKSNDCNSAYHQKHDSIPRSPTTPMFYDQSDKYPLAATSIASEPEGLIGYYEQCDPNKLNCDTNMVCVPTLEDQKIFVCDCLPSLEVNKATRKCQIKKKEPVITAENNVNRVAEGKNKNIKAVHENARKLFTIPVIVAISLLLVALIGGAIVMLVVFKCKSYEKFGKIKYKRMSNGSAPVEIEKLRTGRM